ncbi:MAG: peptide-methionine (S)-S-oxide reductase MsrA [Propioniciclava sp.]|uniref:peptide-methionine (S)-S-oxide reductase MsrA n=1 Tax=Propioniciclava sp. TaxID=2038686 RepID=UPI0039E39336
MNNPWARYTPRMVDPRVALPGRDQPILPAGVRHEIFGCDILATPAGSEVVHLALGCFWGAEKLYWTTPGVTNTAVGYQGGFTPNPTYAEVCSGRTGHAEAVRVCFDPAQVSLEQLLAVFFENHDPTQGMRQGNDIGTQYRSAIFASPGQADAAASVLARSTAAFAEAGFGPVTTELITGPMPFYPAEAEHQQYLVKNPHGYCPVHATGVTCG